MSLLNVFMQYIKKQDYINKNEIAIIEYGIRHMCVIVITIITYLLLGYLFNEAVEIIFYIIIFAGIRRYSGGYHATTKFRCYFESVCLVLVAIIMLKYINISGDKCMIITSIQMMIVYFMAPIMSTNKPIDNIESRYYKSNDGITISLNLDGTLSAYTAPRQGVFNDLKLEVDRAEIEEYVAKSLENNDKVEL